MSDQRSVSLPKAWMEWITKYYEENKDALNKLEINSPSKLVRVLANFGKPKLEKLISDLQNSQLSEKGEKSG